jgi:isoamylase
VLALREQQKRNFLTTMLLSQGVPMIVHGDELGRTQLGNNNVYAQDSPLAWVDWQRAVEYFPLIEFVGAVSKLRAEHPVFRRRRFLRGRPVAGQEAADLAWFTPGGEQMSDDDWEAGYAKSVAVFYNGDAIREPGLRGERLTDDSFLVLFNAHFEDIAYTMPPSEYGTTWEVVIDTAAPMVPELEERRVKTGESIDVDARSILVLQRTG